MVAVPREECLAQAGTAELMWGLPGSMLACVHMAEMADAARWRGTFEAQAQRLLDDLQDTTGSPIWTQDLYGAQRQYLGPVHGFAGNRFSGHGSLTLLSAPWEHMLTSPTLAFHGELPSTAGISIASIATVLPAWSRPLLTRRSHRQSSRNC
jgi:hypothetical protein